MEYRLSGRTEGLVVGLIIMSLGVAIMLDRAGYVSVFGMHVFWPMVFICIGLVRLLERRKDGRRAGGWWVFIGAWLLIADMGLLQFRRWWPIFLVALGVSIIWKAVFPPHPSADMKAQ
jgi:hypothetical protein